MANNTIPDALKGRTAGTISLQEDVTGNFTQWNCTKIGNEVYFACIVIGADHVANGPIFKLDNPSFRPQANRRVLGYIVVNSTVIPTTFSIYANGNIVVSYSATQRLTQAVVIGNYYI